VNRLSRIEGGRALSFQLGASDYEHLRKSPTHPPRMLIVVETAPPRRWLGVGSARLLLHATAWYAMLEGSAPLPAGQNSTAVRIPEKNRFTPSALLANMRSCP
jgi:hypothetical protein